MGQQKDADQTEKPTEKKIQDARKEGNVHRSKDLSYTVQILLWLLMFWLLAGRMGDHIHELFQAVFQQISSPSNTALIDTLFLATKLFALAILPLLAAACVVGLLVEFLQVGSIFAPKKLVPKFSHLNPAEGIKRIFSKDNLIEVLKALIKCAILVSVVALIVFSMLDQYLKLPYGSVPGILATHWQAVRWVLAAVIFAFFFVSILDVIYQRHSYIKNMMMSKRDIKQEMKDSEGDPMIKGQRRQLQQEWAQQNSLAAVRKARVVVTNPTHIAVAIQYEKGETELPIVVAKGEGYMAQLIRETAEEAGIPIMQNVSLARGLFQDIEVDSYITSDFFQAVAEVLKWADSIHQEKERGQLS